MCLHTEALTQGFFQLQLVSEGRDTSGAQRDNVVHHTEEHEQVLRELSKVTLRRSRVAPQYFMSVDFFCHPSISD